MLIDWCTFTLTVPSDVPYPHQELFMLSDRIMRVSPRTGEVVWETPAWDTIRSDSHQVVIRMTARGLTMQGSPARCIGDADAVFGSGAARDLDLVGCWAAMLNVATSALPDKLANFLRWTPAQWWRLSRVDVTGNFVLPSLEDVRSALSVLRDVEGGRYRVSQQAGDTVYWSHRSRRRSGKAYAKGPHLRYLMNRKDYDGRRYNVSEVMLADRLLRLELRLGSNWFSDYYANGKWWVDLKADDLRQEFHDFFGRMLGSVEVKTFGDLYDHLLVVTGSENMARAVMGTWSLIESLGWETARGLVSRATWYRHLKILRQAGLGDADISRGRIVAVRRRVLELADCDSWEQLRRLAA